ncbi:nicotinate phosphoribosyltransferase, partial [Acinetobacter baumannii]
LKYKEDELQYLRKLRFIKSDFVDYLELFQLKRRFIQASIDAEGRLDIHIEGPMVQAMMFEIFVLAIVNELYFSRIKTDQVWAEGERRLQAKLDLIQQYEKSQQPNDPPFLVSDFGTRRRYSFAWQKHVVAAFHKTVPNVFRGTSNVLLAKELNITPIGTMAHEFLQAFQALDVRLRDFQKAALETWVQEYRGDLGIALTDVVGMDAFLRDFDLYFAK